MQAVQEIALEGIRQTVQGIVKKGVLFAFMLLVLAGLVYYIEREKKDCAQAIKEQSARIDTLTGQMLGCMLQRAEQSYEIKTLKEQVHLLISSGTRRKK